MRFEHIWEMSEKTAAEFNSKNPLDEIKNLIDQLNYDSTQEYNGPIIAKILYQLTNISYDLNINVAPFLLQEVQNQKIDNLE